MSHLLNRRSASICLLLASVLSNPMRFSAQNPSDNSFSIDNNTYYLHQISYYDLRNIQKDLSIGLWNQTIISNRDYIYLADHSTNPIKDNAENYDLEIKRYSAIDGTEVDPIYIKWEDIYKYEIDLTTTHEQRCFYLVGCNDYNHFIIALNTPDDGINPSDFNYEFFLLDSDGHIKEKICANKLPWNELVNDFGIPEIIGNPLDGDFLLFLPIVDEIGQMAIVKYRFENTSKGHEMKSCSIVYSHVRESGSGMNTSYTKPTVHIIDNNFMLIDDIDINPSIICYSLSDNKIYDSLENINIKGHGCNVLDFDDHRLLYTGDLFYPEDDTTKCITQFNIGLWDISSAPSNITNRSLSDNSVDFNNYLPLASLRFGQSSIASSSRPLSYAYRQFMAVSDYGNNVKHLHFYVPGEFLATYQLNKHDIPTGIDQIATEAGKQYINLSVKDKQLSFDRPIGNISVFNYMGAQIFNSAVPVTTVDLSRYAHGIYIITTPEKSFKISL